MNDDDSTHTSKIELARSLLLNLVLSLQILDIVYPILFSKKKKKSYIQYNNIVSSSK